MAVTIDSGHRMFTIGNVFSRAFGVMGGAAPTVFGISFLFYALPQAVWSYITPALMGGTTLIDITTLWIVAAIGGLLVLALALIVQGALVRIVIAHGEGRAVPLSECVRIGVRTALPMLGLTVIAYFAVMFGLLLLIVPGVILALMWCVAGPALVDERLGVIASLGRSRYLTRGARGRIFGLLLLLFVIVVFGFSAVAVVTVATGGLDAMNNQTPTIFATILNLIANTLFTALWSAVTTSLYVELRQWKDGLDPGNLEAVFS